MKYTSILITGGAGFIGSNLALSLKQRHPHADISVIDNLKRRGSELNIPRLNNNRVHFMHGDIRTLEDLQVDKKFDLLIECSAEPAVLSGFSDNPLYVTNTNLMGTVHCLELARKNKADVIFLSSSRVYPHSEINKIQTQERESRFEWVKSQDITGWSINGVQETFTLSGTKSLYGATKLSSELILQEYADAYGMHFVINRCGVIAGPWQFGKVDQGVFTLWVLAHYFKRELSYIGFEGKGKQVRDLLHVDDLCDLINLQIEAMDAISGNVYNVGGGKDLTLSLYEATDLCRTITGNRIKVTPVSQQRPGDIMIYYGDNAKIKQALQWSPKKTAEQILTDIFTWIKEHDKSISILF